LKEESKWNPLIIAVECSIFAVFIAESGASDLGADVLPVHAGQRVRIRDPTKCIYNVRWNGTVIDTVNWVT